MLPEAAARYRACLAHPFPRPAGCSGRRRGADAVPFELPAAYRLRNAVFACPEGFTGPSETSPGLFPGGSVPPRKASFRAGFTFPTQMETAFQFPIVTHIFKKCKSYLNFSAFMCVFLSLSVQIMLEMIDFSKQRYVFRVRIRKTPSA